MARPSNRWLGVGIAASILLPLPAAAHKVEVSGDVAGTWHLEPNHSPKAGEPAQVWVALTQAGGRPLPLEQCDCQLQVYRGEQPVLTPELEAVAAEGRQGIPGAEIVFPEVGEYRLVLSGAPRSGEGFQPFEISYTTAVAAGRAAAAQPAPEPATPAPAAPPPEEAVFAIPGVGISTPTALIVGLLGGALAGLAAFIGFRRRHPSNSSDQE